MAKLFFRVAANEYCQWLEPSDRASEEFMSYKVKEGDILSATIRRPRNPKHHAKWWALLSLIHESTEVQDRYPSVENLNDAIKLALGYCDQIILPDGKCALKVKSIAFESMDQTAFEDFYSRAVDVIVTQLVPHLNREDLERQVLEMTK